MRIEHASGCIGEARGTSSSSTEIEECVRKWATLYGITGYKIRINVFNNPDDEDTAYVTAQPEYQTADLSFNLARIDDLEATVRHELAHILIWPLFHIARTMAQTDVELEWVRYANETVAEALERMPGMSDDESFEFEPEEDD